MAEKRASEIVRSVFSPAKFLAGTNIAGMALSFITGLITARLIRPEFIGVAAVIAGIGTSVGGFIDIRLWELAGKLYYKEDLPPGDDRAAYRASVLQVCVAAIAAQSLLITVITIGICSFGLGYFTDAHVRDSWIVYSAVMAGATCLSGAMSYLLRFSERFYLIGILKIGLQVFSMAVIIPFMIWKPDLDGYFYGRVITSVAQAVIMLAVTAVVWGAKERLPILRRGAFKTLRAYAAEFRFMFYGNLMGYSKMISRSFDVLLVARFCSDRETGIYKIARTLSDAVFTLYDAMNQVYYPSFLMLINKKMKAEYRRLATRMAAVSAGLTIVVAALEWLLFPAMIKFVIGERYANSGLEISTIVMTLPLFVIAGIQLWVWPMFVYSGRLGVFTMTNYIACGAQFLVAGALFLLLPPTPLFGALGMLAYYIFMGPMMLTLAKRRFPSYIPDMMYFGERPKTDD